MNGAYGMLAEFDNPEDLVVAALRAREEGYRRFDAHTPFPVHGLTDAIGHDWRVPWIIFVGGIAGGLTGFGLQSWVSKYAYPLNVGGRPYIPWPSFVPVTFELTVLFAAFAAVIGMLALNGLPRPHHPIFNSARFDLVSTDRFFLCIEASDPKYDPEKTQDFLKEVGAQTIEEVPK